VTLIHKDHETRGHESEYLRQGTVSPKYQDICKEYSSNKEYYDVKEGWKTPMGMHKLKE
jgi:hypothetical protein